MPALVMAAMSALRAVRHLEGVERERPDASLLVALGTLGVQDRRDVGPVGERALGRAARGGVARLVAPAADRDQQKQGERKSGS